MRITALLFTVCLFCILATKKVKEGKKIDSHTIRLDSFTSTFHKMIKIMIFCSRVREHHLSESTTYTIKQRISRKYSEKIVRFDKTLRAKRSLLEIISHNNESRTQVINIVS